MTNYFGIGEYADNHSFFTPRSTVLVKVVAHFRCQTKGCKGQQGGPKEWPSAHAWISFNMHQQNVKRM